MVSEFLSPNEGRLMYEGREARIVFKAGKNHDGYFENKDLLKQTKLAMEIFNEKHPGDQMLIIFNNATAMKSLSGSRAHKFRSIPTLHGISGGVLRLVRTLLDQNSPIHRGKGKWERCMS
jgi:hypothetical protein